MSRAGKGKSNKGTGANPVRSYLEFEERYFPAFHKRKQAEEERRQPAKHGTGIIRELMDEAVQAAKKR